VPVTWAEAAPETSRAARQADVKILLRIENLRLVMARIYMFRLRQQRPFPCQHARFLGSAAV